MKICFFIQWLKTGGAERVTSTLANYLVENGNSVDIVLLGNTIEFPVNEKVNIIKFNDFQGHESPITVFKKMKQRKKAFSDYVNKNKPDIIVCLLNSLLLYIDKKITIPIVSSERNNPFKELGLFKRKISFLLYKRCDGLVFQTERALKSFPKYLTKNACVIPNPVSAIQLKKHYSFIERDNRVVAIGRLYRSKGFYFLVDSFKKVLKKNCDCILEIYGEGEEKERLEKYILRNKLSEKVFLRGRINVVENPELIASAKCFVLSSKYEGLPNVLLEAMSLGIPSVANNCDFGPSDIIKHKTNGLLAKYNSVDSMSFCINEFLNNDSLSNFCSQNAIKVQMEYSKELICKKFLNYFVDIINKKSYQTNNKL